MKKRIAILCLVPCLAHSQPAPTFEASSNQVNAGTVGAPFYVSPRGLAAFQFVATNLALTDATNIANQRATAATNALMTYVGNPTNFVLLSGSNGPPVAGQALVITGTNASGATVAKSTNWPTGGGGGLTLSDVTNVSQSIVNTASNILQVQAGTNIVVVGSKVSVADPAAFNSVTVTNFNMPTNSFAGNVADFSKSLWVTNGGSINITSLANLTAGMENDLVIIVGTAGVNLTASFPITFHTNLISGVVTNGNINRYLLCVLPTMYSNVYELPSR